MCPLRPLEDILALLTRAGFSGPDALHIYWALFGFLHGHVLDELQELIENPDETDDLLRLGLHRLAADRGIRPPASGCIACPLHRVNTAAPGAGGRVCTAPQPTQRW